MLTDRQIISFQLLWKKNFGEEISKKEAYDKGEKLVNLMRVICCPNKQEKKDNKD